MVGEPSSSPPSSTDLSHPEASPTFIGKRQRRLNGKSSVTIHPSPSWADAGVQAGIAYYKDEHRHVSLFVDASASEIGFEMHNKAKGIFRSERHRVEVGDVRLRISYTEQDYRLWYEVGNGTSTCLAVVDTLDMTGPDFVGPVIGAFSVAKRRACHVECTELSID